MQTSGELIKQRRLKLWNENNPLAVQLQMLSIFYFAWGQYVVCKFRLPLERLLEWTYTNPNAVNTCNRGNGTKGLCVCVCPLAQYIISVNHSVNLPMHVLDLKIMLNIDTLCFPQLNGLPRLVLNMHKNIRVQYINLLWYPLGGRGRWCLSWLEILSATSCYWISIIPLARFYFQWRILCQAQSWPQFLCLN